MGRRRDGGTEGRRDRETGRKSSSSHLSIPPSLCLSVPPSLRLPFSLSFPSVNVEFLRVTFDRRARLARQREQVVATIFGSQVDLFEQLDDRRIRAQPDVLGFKLHDGEAGGGQRHSDLVRRVFASVLVVRRLA